MKSKISAFWNKLDLFCKISAIALILVVILTIIAIVAKNVFAIIFSVLQLVGLIVALLIHNDVIKMEKKIKWIRFLILVVAVALSYLNIVSYSWGKNKTDDSISTNQPTYSDSSISDEAETTKETTKKKPFPFGTEECIGNKESIKYDIKDAGFTNLTLNAIEDLSPSETERVGEIESITVNGQSEFTKGQEFDYDSEVVITYHEYKKCKVTVRVDFLSNLIFSKYNVNIKFDGLKEGILEHGVDGDFEFMVRPGEHTITFESAETSSVTGEAKINVDCDIDVSYQISCYNDKVTVTEKYLDRLVEVPEGKIKLEAPVSEYKYKNYSEVESALKSLGFTNIKYEILYDIVFGITQEGEVEKVSIAGNSDFKRGDIFSADDEIIITYHMKEEDGPNKKEEASSGTSTTEKPSPVFYSTNDYETAKKGNTGVFSYKNKSGSYDVYWIIDFDEGYVYNFFEGNGDSTCDKVKIVSGDLNNKVAATWHDGGDQWTWYLHFKYVNSPVTLIVNDHHGSAYEFTTTDLDKALSVRNTKTIKEY